MNAGLMTSSERALKDTLGAVAEIFLRRDHAGARIRLALVATSLAIYWLFLALTFDFPRLLPSAWVQSLVFPLNVILRSGHFSLRADHPGASHSGRCGALARSAPGRTLSCRSLRIGVALNCQPLSPISRVWPRLRQPEDRTRRSVKAQPQQPPFPDRRPGLSPGSSRVCRRA